MVPGTVGRADRGIAPVVGAALMIVIIVILAGVVSMMLTGFGTGLEQDPRAGIKVTEVKITGTGDCGGDPELALDVTLVSVTRAETIVVQAEGGSGQTLWSNPGANVGDTKRIANENVGSHGVDVDVGGGGDWCLESEDDALFRFIAEYNGESTVVQTHTT